MAVNEVNYLQLLREEIDLFKELADIRKEKNDLRDAKFRAWDQHRYQLKSNKEFEEFWQTAKPVGIDEHLRVRESEIFGQLDRMKVVLEHLRFAGLDDLADFSGNAATIDATPTATAVRGSSRWGWPSRRGRSAVGS